MKEAPKITGCGRLTYVIERDRERERERERDRDGIKRQSLAIKRAKTVIKLCVMIVRDQIE